MAKYFEKILLLITGAAITLLFVKSCSSPVNPDIVYIPGDSIPYTVYNNVPVPYEISYRDSIPVHDTVWLDGDTTYIIEPVDTMVILRDYFAKVYYKDTVKNDSSALIVLNETVSKNRIAHREVIFQNRRATAIIEERKKAIVLGAGANVKGLDVSVGYRMNRNVLNLTYSNHGFGLRYQRELGWKTRSEK